MIENNRVNFLPNEHRVDGFFDEADVYEFENGELLETYREELLPKLVSLWSSALSRTKDDSLVVEDAGKYPFEDRFKVLLVVKDDDVAAIYLYTSLEYQGVKGVNVNICLIDERYQGKGLMKKLIRKSIEDTKAVFMKFNTQNEHMVAVARSFCPSGLLFPIDGEVSGGGAEMAEFFSGKREEFEVSTMVQKKMYGNGSPLYGDRLERRSVHEDIRNFFDNNIDFKNGDAVMVIGFIES